MILEDYSSVIISINTVLIIAAYTLNLERFITSSPWKSKMTKVLLGYSALSLVFMLSGSFSRLSIGTGLSFSFPLLHTEIFRFS